MTRRGGVLPPAPGKDRPASTKTPGARAARVLSRTAARRATPPRGMWQPHGLVLPFKSAEPTTTIRDGGEAPAASVVRDSPTASSRMAARAKRSAGSGCVLLMALQAGRVATEPARGRRLPGTRPGRVGLRVSLKSDCPAQPRSPQAVTTDR